MIERDDPLGQGSIDREGIDDSGIDDSGIDDSGIDGEGDDDEVGSDRFLQAGDRALESAYEEPMSLAEYVDGVLGAPSLASHASKYLLEAIESAGTRTVIEKGEERERYRFFDNPHSDGEYAVLGSTETLNAFVDGLRSIAAGQGRDEKMIWFAGPTATGKSELKRCLIDELREYSRTGEGRRYTVEWNVTGATGAAGESYGIVEPTDEDDWYPSPVQTNPLSVFPESIRKRLLERANRLREESPSVQVDTDMDPFSREAYEYLEKQYRHRGVDDLFTAITDPNHLRVKNYVMDVGRGIGVLHAEDDGTPKERLVGEWMPGMLQKLDSRGRKNPQAFSYDGVLSQGNGGLTIVEDAAQHADLLRKLLNVPEEGRVKLDRGIGMEIDTQIVVISNPDLEATLNQHADREGADPLKALKRRLDRHEFTYLIDISLEAQLIRRELTGETDIWEAESYEAYDRRIREPVRIQVRETDRVRERELAPHAIEAAAVYSVITRLSDESLPTELDLVDKALLFDRGYLEDGDERRRKEEFDLESTTDGRHGIPVTYTRDVLADLLRSDTDRRHQDLPVEDVIMPRDVLNAMVEGLADAPVFSPHEQSEFESRVAAAKTHVFDRQEDDVIAAITHDHGVDPRTVEEYIEHVYAWETTEPIENDRGERVAPDPLKMKVFETDHLGRFDESDYEGNRPTSDVVSFRRKKVITALNRHAWDQRGEDFAVENADLTEIPVLRSVLDSSSWDDIARIYEDFDPTQWEDPPANTETAALKAQTIEALVDRYGYSPASAELTSRHVIAQVSYRWD